VSSHLQDEFELRSRLRALLDAGPAPVSADEAIRHAVEIRGSEHSGGRMPGTPRGARGVRGFVIGRRRLVVSIAFCVAVIVLVGSLAITVRPGGSSPAGKPTVQPGGSVNESPGLGGPIAPASLVREVTSVPQSVFNTVGLPSELTNLPSSVPSSVVTKRSSKTPLLYVWASYCPFCAAQNWALVMALSRFGAFSDLRLTASSATDFAPNTQTLSFYGAKYSSPYFRFESYDIATNEPAASDAKCNVYGHSCLEALPAVDDAIWQSKALGGGEGSLPFMYFGGKLFQFGDFPDEPLLLAGLTRMQIATELHDPSSPVAQAEVGEANYFTAAICQMTGGRPSAVCSTAVVRKAEARER